MQALAQIGQEDAASAARVVTVLTAVLTDRKEEAVVKQSALDGLAVLADKANALCEEILPALVAVQAEGNPRLAKKAQEVLSNVCKASPAEIEKARQTARP